MRWKIQTSRQTLYWQNCMTSLRNIPRTTAQLPASQPNIRLLQHTEIAAFISLYREDGKLWVQLRIGYMFGTAVCIRQRKNFRTFMTRRSHNPLRLPSGQCINLRECFVNDHADPEHRWGFDLIVDDVGFERCAELIDYLLTRSVYIAYKT